MNYIKQLQADKAEALDSARSVEAPPLSSHALATFTARPKQAIGMASAKWIGTGFRMREIDS